MKQRKGENGLDSRIAAEACATMVVKEITAIPKQQKITY